MNFFKRWFSRQKDKTSIDTETKSESLNENLPPSLMPECEKSDGFLTRYLQYLQGSHAYLKFKGLSHGHISNIALNSVYIALKAVAGEGYQEESHLDLYKQIDSILKKALSDEHHFHTRWKLTEAYALLTRKEDFIHKRIIQPILSDEMQAGRLRSQGNVPQMSSFASDDKNRLEAFAILCKLEYYTDDLIHQIIKRLTSFSQPLCKQALAYLSAAPSIPKVDRPALHTYLNNVINDDSADGILRNRAFETLYNIYDLLSESLDE